MFNNKIAAPATRIEDVAIVVEDETDGWAGWSGAAREKWGKMVEKIGMWQIIKASKHDVIGSMFSQRVTSLTL